MKQLMICSSAFWKSNCDNLKKVVLTFFQVAIYSDPVYLWDIKEPTHCSQRVGDVVPGVVVWSLCAYSHGLVSKCSEILAA